MASNESPSSLSLTALLAHISNSLSSSSSSSSTSTNADPIPSILSLLSLASSRTQQLSLISENDSLQEINTKALRSLFIGSLAGNAWSAKRNAERDHLNGYGDRKKNLRQSQVQYKNFLSQIANLKILSPSLTSLITSQIGPISSSSSSTSETSIPKMDKRSLKITLFKTERSLISELESFRKVYREKNRKKNSVTSNSASEVPETAFFDLLVLSSSSGGDEDSEDEEDQDEEKEGSSNNSSPRSLRSYLLLLLNLHSLSASSSLESISQELSLLDSMPSASEMSSQRTADMDARERVRGKDGDGDEWRLTRSVGDEGGALMDDKGKPLRPFTITNGSSGGGTSGSGAGAYTGPAMVEISKREQLRKEVFKNGARLPTMTIDEYLEEEQRRGNILTGGGPEGAAKATPREERSMRAENDGTREGEEAEEEARREAVEWDTFTEANRKGEGNTMNRG